MNRIFLLFLVGSISICRPLFAAELTLTDDISLPGTSLAGKSQSLKLSSKTQNTVFLRFDLASLPSGLRSNSISKATLRIFTSAARGTGGIGVKAVTTEWNEEQAIGKGPTVGSPIATINPVIASGSYQSADITGLVRAWATGSTNYGLALTTTAGDLQAFIDSKENKKTSHPPVIEVTLNYTNIIQGVAGPQGPQGLPGQAGLNGTNGIAGPMGPQGIPGTNFLHAVAGGALSGTYPNPTLASNAVTVSAIADGSITAEKMAPLPAGIVQSSTPFSVPNNTFVTVPFTDVVLLHNMTLQTNALYIQKTGIYEISGKVNAFFATGYRILYIVVNNSQVTHDLSVSNANFGFSQNVFSIQKLNAGDRVLLVVYQTSGGTVNYASGSPYNSHLAVHWLGAE